MHTSALIITLFIATVHVAAIPYPHNTNSGDAYSGVGGQAPGGPVSSTGANSDEPYGTLINLLSNNAGDGGAAGSGSTAAGSRSYKGTYSRISSTKIGPNTGSAYSGAGGQAPGGSVTNNGGGSMLNILSNNAGDGGNGKSGDARAGSL